MVVERSNDWCLADYIDDVMRHVDAARDCCLQCEEELQVTNHLPASLSPLPPQSEIQLIDDIMDSSSNDDMEDKVGNWSDERMSPKYHDLVGYEFWFCVFRPQFLITLEYCSSWNHVWALCKVTVYRKMKCERGMRCVPPHDFLDRNLTNGL